MTNKKSRLSELAKLDPIASLDHRYLKDEHGNLTILKNMTRNERRRIQTQGKKIAQEYKKILNGLENSGAKFPANNILREMAIEYTHRYASSGIYTQPISFNYFEPFLHIKLIQKLAPAAYLEEENNHLFYATDFFEFITSPDSDEFNISTLAELPQDKIFHFSASGDLSDISFLNGEGRDFVIAGFSMIRRGGLLHWYLIGGEALDSDEWALRSSSQPEVDLKHTDPLKQAFLSESMRKVSNQRGAPKPLEGTQTFIRTIVAGEFDLGEKKHLARCYLAEYENSFDVVCDDPEIFISMGNAEFRENAIKSMTKRFSKSSVLWSLAEGFFQLPRYFNARVSIHSDDRKNTRKKIQKKKGGQGLNANYIVVPSLEVSNASPTSTITMVNLPHYEIETDGHWKKLPDNEHGVDRHGNPVRGRTWISSSSKWKCRGQPEGTIFLKDTLAAARLKIGEYTKVSQSSMEKADTVAHQISPNEGELYVMRCIAMKEPIFKIGFTRGNSLVRARELSSATGVPLAFSVVKKWQHREAKKLETEVHMMLSPYRINDSREFFMVDFDVIEKIIEDTIFRTGT